MDFVNVNDAIKWCWDSYKPNYSIASQCAHSYISKFTKEEVERQREYNKQNPIIYRPTRIRRY